MTELPTIRVDRETQRRFFDLLSKGIWMIKIKKPFSPEMREVVLYRDASEVREEFDPKPLLEEALNLLGEEWIFSFMGEIELFKGRGEVLGEMRFYKIETNRTTFGEGEKVVSEKDVRLPVARIRLLGIRFTDLLMR